MALYLIDKPFGQDGLALAEIDPDAKVVLLQDGVYLDPSRLSGKPVYAVKADVERRGLERLLADWVQRIDYAQLVDLIVDNKILNFA